MLNNTLASFIDGAGRGVIGVDTLECPPFSPSRQVDCVPPPLPLGEGPGVREGRGQHRSTPARVFQSARRVGRHPADAESPLTPTPLPRGEGLASDPFVQPHLWGLGRPSASPPLRLSALVVLVDHHRHHQQDQEDDRHRGGDWPVVIGVELVVEHSANHLDIAAAQQVGDDVLPGRRNEHQQRAGDTENMPPSASSVVGGRLRTVIQIKLPTESGREPISPDDTIGAWQGNSRQRPKQPVLDDCALAWCETFHLPSQSHRHDVRWRRCVVEGVDALPEECVCRDDCLAHGHETHVPACVWPHAA